MKKGFISVFAVMIFTALTSGVYAQDWSSDQKEVWQAVEEGWKAFQDGDIEASKALIHDKYQGWSNEYPLPSNKAKVLKHYAMMSENMKVMYFDMEPARITVVGDAAVVHYYFNFVALFSYEGKEFEREMEGKNAEFYIKEKGKWVLLGDMTYVVGDKK
jgi:ketosteroid isomerase-like protein